MTHYLLERPVHLGDGVGKSQVVGQEGILFTTEVPIRSAEHIGGSFDLEPEADGATLRVVFQAIVQEVCALPESGRILVYARFQHLTLVTQRPASLMH